MRAPVPTKMAYGQVVMMPRDEVQAIRAGLNAWELANYGEPVYSDQELWAAAVCIERELKKFRERKLKSAPLMTGGPFGNDTGRDYLG